MASRIPDPDRDILVPACLADKKTAINHKMIFDSAKDLSGKIIKRYSHSDITLIPIMTGAFVFANDIFRHLHVDDSSVFASIMLRPVWAKSYKGSRRGDFEFHSFGLNESHIKGRKIILVDDILDTGRTITLIQAFLKTFEPDHVTTVVMTRKPGKTNCGNMTWPVEDEFVGLDIEDEFVVGYGLDLDERYRELPTIKKFVQRNPTKKTGRKSQ
jgi:hypoxanthine phosphoribosyltransferase